MTDTRAAICAIFAGVVALSFLNTLPALIVVVTSGLNWDDRAIGIFASAGLGGLTLGGLLGVLVIRRIGLRTVISSGLALLAVTHFASGAALGFSFIVCFEFLAGVCGGVILSACFGIYSYSHPQRNFGALLVGQMVSALAGVTAIPVLARLFGWRSSFYTLALFSLCVLPLAIFLPTSVFRGSSVSTIETTDTRGATAPWLALAGAAIFMIGASPIWTYMARIGENSGIAATDVNFAISCSTAAGLLGAILSMLPSKKWGLAVALLGGVLVAGIALGMILSLDAIVYTVAICLFMFTWPILNAAQFAAVALRDTAGTATISLSPAMSAGFAIGPLIGGQLIDRHGFQSLQYMALTGAAAALLCLVPVRLALTK